ncbi:MAG: polysaccharide deacetylase family protein [Sphingomonadaceae bacterium]|nr:polysaccharide deacetylase family protein [Sphingomonadaceae bacterium]
MALPPEFGRRALIFVDTEEEFDWNGPRHRDASVEAIVALPAMHARLHAAGFVPTYLVTHPIATDRRAAEMLGGWRADGACAVGAQLHPWVTPPLIEPLTTPNSFAGMLPRTLEAEKLAVLTHAITEGVGERPTIYRAGRYGVGPATAAILAEQGYRLDVSVRPGFDYSAQGGPDFLRHDVASFRAGPEGAITALPLSSGFTGALRMVGPRLFERAGRRSPLRALLARTGLLARVALTPEDYPLRDAERLVRRLLRDGARVLSFSFHSPSLVPGNTPYVRDARDLERFHAWWEEMFAILAREGVAPASAAEFMAAAGLKSSIDP